MKKEEVPQDKSNLESAHFNELCYAVDKDGKYTTALSSGWDPKTIALDNAIKDIEERVEHARQKFLKGEGSPIEYFMELNKMDLQILSSYMGLWQWRVKRHFKPNIFKGLSPDILKKYAETFEIAIEELKSLGS